ncbi:hypothetical protein GCM10009846_19720 [Agrococcus versicolor]|uniref:Gram-positive cocci surface proteins LPxTG domain-containing protein n=1 Tax=Agrococcus versicolor TaxID=501482 RepID=A0ABN3ASL7_9MICO
MRAVGLLVLSAGLALVAAAPANAAPSTEVIQGEVIRLESVQDAAAMATMDLGRPVAWDVGVTAARSDGTIELSLAVAATPNAYAATVRWCSAPWSETGCAAGATPVVEATLVDGAIELGAQSAAETRWYRIDVELIQRIGGATAAIDFRASGAGETVESGGEASLPTTGQDSGVVAAFGLAIVAIATGIVVAAVARRARERALT